MKMMNKLFRKQKQTMTEMQEIETNYPYTIEVGHSKSGSNHVMIIKSLKVQGGDLVKVFQDLQAALKAYELLNNDLEA
tara:strand:- start:159 stop:392 length:234 start_codon:yes stop_codon:yes gene_type:complete